MSDLFQELVLNPIMRCIEVFADKHAFFINGAYYTYKEFGAAVETERLRMKEEPATVCAVEVRDDLRTYASIVALWLEGKAFVPMNPRHPEGRNQMIVEQVARFEPHYNDSLAYVLFTSGSTGAPKGVAISRKNVGAFMDSFWKTGIKVDEHDRCLQCFDLTFDVAVQSFLVALTRGACVYTVPYGQVKYLSVASLIHEQHITVGAMAPSMLAYLRPYFDELDASSLKTCILTAEACPLELIDAWQQCAKNATVYDFYGPTEGTVYATYYECGRTRTNLSANGIVSIGKPLAHVGAVVVDDGGKTVTAPFVKGELWLTGDQVTQGYWNDAARNAASFSVVERNGEPQRFYHTGDLCYWDVSGNLLYVGRLDQQVKIQGFRVELQEIEFHARNFYDNATQVAAMAFHNEDGLSEIALFVERPEESTEALASYLRGKLPPYMIPSRWICVDPFPLNSNDKIDKTKLKEWL